MSIRKIEIEHGLLVRGSHQAVNAAVVKAVDEHMDNIQRHGALNTKTSGHLDSKEVNVLPSFDVVVDKR